MTNPKKQDRDARREQIQKLKAQQRAQERRRNFLIYGGTGLVLLGLVVWVAVVIGGEARKSRELSEAAAQPIAGVQTYEDLSNRHVETAVEYDQNPGVGGDHSPVWTNCGVYTEPVDEGRGIHSMEHGAVWITYRPDLPQREINLLTDLVGERSYVLLSPNPDQETPVAASAWGTQLTVDTASDSRLAPFLAKYVQGEQTPEPGAACTGGVDG